MPICGSGIGPMKIPGNKWKATSVNSNTGSTLVGCQLWEHASNFPGRACRRWSLREHRSSKAGVRISCSIPFSFENLV
jgi:hypothetical protein